MTIWIINVVDHSFWFVISCRFYSWIKIVVCTAISRILCYCFCACNMNELKIKHVYIQTEMIIIILSLFEKKKKRIYRKIWMSMEYSFLAEIALLIAIAEQWIFVGDIVFCQCDDWCAAVMMWRIASQNEFFQHSKYWYLLFICMYRQREWMRTR